MRKYLALTLILLCIGCTGCAAQGNRNLTEEENDMIAEYIAGVLLKYDMRYEDSLEYELQEENTVDSPQVSEETPEPPKENIKDTSVDSSDTEESADVKTPSGTKTADVELSDIYGMEGLKVTYAGSEDFTSYTGVPENSCFLLEPSSENHKLLVLSFKLKNTGSSKKTVELLNSGISYKLDGEGGVSAKPLVVPLDDALQYLSVTIEGGKSMNAVLIFDVPKTFQSGSGSLTVTKGTKTARITV